MMPFSNPKPKSRIATAEEFPASRPLPTAGTAAEEHVPAGVRCLGSGNRARWQPTSALVAEMDVICDAPALGSR